MATFTKLKSGKTRVQVRMDGVYEGKTFHTKGQAQTWARQVEMQIQDGTYRNYRELANLPILLNLLDRYEKEITVEKKSAVNERAFLRILARQSIADYRIDKITSRDIDELISEMREDYKPSTIRRYLSPLRHLFNVAKKSWKYNITNPFSDVQLPRMGKLRERRLSAVEQEALINEATKHRNPEMLAMIELALETGMRRGELLKLEWRHLNIVNKTISLFDTKNGTNRGIPLSCKALDVLNTIEHINNKIFHYTGDGFQSSWQKVLTRTRIEDLCFHDFRHEATSRFFEKGLNMMEVASITGHKDLASLKRYTHLEAYKLADKL